jgi:hypothetical protein
MSYRSTPPAITELYNLVDIPPNPSPKDSASSTVSHKSIFKKSYESTDDNKNKTRANTEASTYTILNSNDLMRSIPQTATTKKKNMNQCTDNSIEWRWRFFNINGRDMIELSYATLSSKRIYTDYMGNKIEYELDDSWDKYVVQTLYDYVN